MTATGRTGRWLLAVAAAVALVVVVTALQVIDPPSHERAERMDRKRLEDLGVLAMRIDAHADVHERLPERLSVVDRGTGPAVVDPGTGRPYGYEVTGERSYRLCAHFETETARADPHAPSQDAWRHGRGHQCFDREAGQDAAVTRPAPAPPG